MEIFYRQLNDLDEAVVIQSDALGYYLEGNKNMTLSVVPELTDSDNQKWIFIGNNIQNLGTGYCLSYRGLNVVLTTNCTAISANWKIIPQNFRS